MFSIAKLAKEIQAELRRPSADAKPEPSREYYLLRYVEVCQGCGAEREKGSIIKERLGRSVPPSAAPTFFDTRHEVIRIWCPACAERNRLSRFAYAVRQVALMPIGDDELATRMLTVLQDHYDLQIKD